MNPTTRKITYGSVCSGIEAASVSVNEKNWKPLWFAEIEEFPSAVLEHRFSHIPNYGDMTQLPEQINYETIPAPDVLVGGTPCQAFSVAGLRDGLNDPRGELTIKFVQLADEIDTVRVKNNEDECVVWWENVPGVLSSKDNAFGCFLGALAGEDSELQPAGKKWGNAGCVYGPKRAIAWRVLDAQYFGLAQRRNRVFLVASARDGFDPAKILFEFDSVRRDSAPRYKYGATEHPTRPEKVPFDMLGFGQYGDGITASTCKARDYKDATDLVIDGGKVRRTTPIEVERVMGFPDDYTRIEWRGKSAEECPDGHRYKALGNSMAVNVMRWIAGRIEQYLSDSSFNQAPEESSKEYKEQQFELEL